MTVYVDDMRAAYGRMKMCHMIADSTEELLTMADRIDLDRRWLQHPASASEHFDISLSKRRRAIEAGAVAMTRRELAARIVARRGIER